jgi:hypothetical protein
MVGISEVIAAAGSQPALPAAPQPRYQTRLNRTLDGIRSFRQSFVNDETKGQVHPMRPALQAGKHRPAASVLQRQLSSGRLSCTERKPPASGAATRRGSRRYPGAKLASAGNVEAAPAGRSCDRARASADAATARLQDQPPTRATGRSARMIQRLGLGRPPRRARCPSVATGCAVDGRANRGAIPPNRSSRSSPKRCSRVVDQLILHAVTGSR